MKWIRLILCLLFFVPACAILGGFAAMDAHANPWIGLCVGAGIGTLFGCIFGGAIGPDSAIAYVLFGPKAPEVPHDNDDNRQEATEDM
jgi:hypothetical protein